ncbi:LOW QUALITY PROTEIN: RNA polymerase sigma factor, partial [Streptomyces sp. e14]
ARWCGRWCARTGSPTPTGTRSTWWIRSASPSTSDASANPTRLGSWLASTARNECLRTLRSLSRLTVTSDPHLLDRVSEESTPEQAVLESEEAAAQSERIRRLWQEFEELGDRCRQLLRVLIASPPPSYQEVSAALGVAVGSIGPLRQRCLRRLRARLDARGTTR